MPTRCRYGNRCTDRTGAHRSKYAHPGTSPRHPCRYGSECHNQSSEHREQYAHPGDQDLNLEPGASGTTPRQPCRYGAECYSRSPAHRLEYAHAGDTDFDSDPVVPSAASSWPCRYGADCYDRSPAHRNKYAHPQAHCSKTDRETQIKRSVSQGSCRSVWATDSAVPDPDPMTDAEIKEQANLGAQTLRPRGSFAMNDASLGRVAADAHARHCFEQMMKNEKRMCGEWAVFYHSYNSAAVLYELQAAVASVLFRFKSSYATLPRLLRGNFPSIPDALTLEKMWPTWPDKDHSPIFKSVAICATTSLLRPDPEATPTEWFLKGYAASVPDTALIEGLVQSCGVEPGLAHILATKIQATFVEFNVGAGGRTGHILQIFMKRHLVDKYVYAALPYGVPDPSRAPLGEHLNGPGPIVGQVRMVVHPSAFLRATRTRVYCYSADPAYHKRRAELQETLTDILEPALGSDQARARAARGIFGAELPAWYSTEDQRQVANSMPRQRGSRKWQ